MTLDALKEWGDKHTQWRREMALARKACLACELEEYMKHAENIGDMQPPADPHEGPHCKRKRKT